MNYMETNNANKSFLIEEKSTFLRM